jgi:lactoylglutathione lyase
MLRLITRGLSRAAIVSLLLGVLGLPLSAQAPQTAPAGDVIGVANFAHIVADVDTSLRFYRDVIGLSVTVTQPFSPNDAIAKLGATEGGQSRIAVLAIPGSELGVELIEYKDIQRTVQRPRFYDPGAANLQLRMRDIDAVFEKIAAFPGAKVITGGGRPVTIEVPNGQIHAVFVQDPDGFVIELAEVANPPAGSPEGNVLGAGFEPAVASSEASVKFYNELLGFNFQLGAAFNDNPTMASTAGVRAAA